MLHASAVVLRGAGGVIGFLGDSGAGKSTLARLLTEAGAEVALAADDLLRHRADRGGRRGGPAPLPPAQARRRGDGGHRGPGAELSRCWGSTLSPRAPAAQVEAGEPLPPVSAAALLLRHTIAGRLFARDLLAAHLDFAADLAGRVPVRRLTVPRRPGRGRRGAASPHTPREVSTIFTVRSRIDRSSQRLQLAM